MKKMNMAAILFAALALASCKKDEEEQMMDPVVETPLNPATSAHQSVDRFSIDAGTLMIRDGVNGLPAVNVAVNFDMAPFITKGLGPGGEDVEYYNFDVMSTNPAPIYVLFKSGSATPVAGQLNIVDVIPGDNSYNDFWNVVMVTVPDSYVANTVTSVTEIFSKGYATTNSDIIVNCPIVPSGSTATKRFGSSDTGLTQGWYNDKVVHYFNFAEAPIMGSDVPLSPIYVTFNINPDMAGGGPPSGFVTEVGTDQTHNVLASLPGDSDYSPLWSVSVYDNNDFATVSSLSSASSSTIMAMDVMTVNCPVVAVN
ncbi:MAG: hypothetical protein SH856_07310 [Flavobacteriales bacterium]|mgnify:CR=1 FL=1|nr:hypothetical protein [Flavobacteriales bacterium]